MNRSRLLLCFVLLMGACNPRIAEGVRKKDLGKDVEILTGKGRIVVRLSDKTPGHRNNFIRLVKKGFYDSILFHRVIKGFVVQTGDPRTKPPSMQDPAFASYTIPAEFDPELFHKRGALNAARTGEEGNPLQASSGTQFTMVQGKLFTDSLLDATEKRVTRMNAYRMVLQDPANKWMIAKLKEYGTTRDSVHAKQLRAWIDTLTVRRMTQIPAYKFPPGHRQMYKTIGGAPHLDGNYVVFGEVITGLEVVDSIGSVATNRERPVQDVRILQMRMIKRKE